MSVGLKQSELLDLPLRDVLDLFRRCDEFAALVAIARATGGKYGRVERMMKEAGELTDEMERLRVKARRTPTGDVGLHESRPTVGEDTFPTKEKD